MSKLITVFGATGNQGGSVIEAILRDSTLSKEFKIRAITRDVTKPSAQALAAKGIEVVAADMSSADALAPAVAGAHTIFLVTNFWETFSADVEIAQGKAVTDAAKAAGVQHLIFSSLLNTTETSGGKLPNISHFDSKSKIEEYIRSTGIPATFVLPGLFMTNLFEWFRKDDKGEYTMALPVSPEKAQVPLLDASGDTGKFVAAAIRHHPQTLGTRIYATTNYYTPAQIAAEFSEVINKPAVAIQIPDDVFKSFLPAPAAQELLENMKLLEDPGYYAGADLKESLSLLSEEPISWKAFAELNKAKWQ
ncbi:hypothetical protein EDB81DRAFT_846736 [Dactylonectria macrodidyma]|uniref:NmrA-like family domain-containing protein 1 n=1 Tax=Dactylonectria macrodidyma TaxID=307937 RepID=A0A9P9IML7_9HYPO|nr:hypothetical protein EDB81DRAFT_846736 [Dactylonectria macrodidyma]